MGQFMEQLFLQFGEIIKHIDYDPNIGFRIFMKDGEILVFYKAEPKKIWNLVKHTYRWHMRNDFTMYL